MLQIGQELSENDDERAVKFLRTFSVKIEDDSDFEITSQLSNLSFDSTEKEHNELITDEIQCENKIDSKKKFQVRFKDDQSDDDPCSCYSDDQLNRSLLNFAITYKDFNFLKPKHFKARPIPKHLLDGTIKTKMINEEEFRKIRIRIRAEEMLKSSTLPFSPRKSLSKSENNSNNNRPRRRIIRKIPNFKLLHFKFAKKYGMKTTSQSPTICKPFALSYEPKKMKHSINESFLFNQDSNTYSIQRSRKFSRSIPTKMTKTTELRKSLNVLKENEKSEELTFKSEPSPKLRKRVISSANTYVKSKESNSDLRKIVTERSNDYKKELLKMQKRISSKPLLMERQIMSGAKNGVEKKFKETLKKCGVDYATVMKNTIPAVKLQFDCSESFSSECSSINSG